MHNATGHDEAQFNPQAYLLLAATMDKKQMPAKPTKHELKTQETRELLLRAAEEIFVRDGYAGAELGEIARLAGRTKGAIYANFKSKEDIFLALYETKSLERRAIMQKRLAESTSTAGNLAAFRRYFIEFAVNDSWAFLLMEFRQYAIRNPLSRERLLKLYRGLLPENEEAAYGAILGPAGKGKKAISRTEAVHTAFAMLTALQLEAKFDPTVVTGEVLKRVAGQLFDAMFPSK